MAGPVVTAALPVCLGRRELISMYTVIPLFPAAMAVWTFRHIGGTKEQPTVAVAHPRMPPDISCKLLHFGGWPSCGACAMTLITLVAILSLYLVHKLQMGTAGRDFHVGLLIAVGLFAQPTADLLSERLSRRHVPGPGLLWPWP